MNSLQINIPINISPAQRSGNSSPAYRKKMAQAMTIVGSLGKSFGNSFARSFVNSFGRSWGRDSWNMRLASPIPGPSPSSDMEHMSGLEDRFCRDFVCCGIQLENLHDLLQHFEECHVHVESDGEEDEDGLPFEFDSIDEMDTDMDEAFADPTASFSSSFLHTQSIALSEIYSARKLQSSLNGDHSGTASLATASVEANVFGNNALVSAFDTSIVRKNSTSSSQMRPRIHPPVFSESRTIPLTFDGPTRVIADVDVEDVSMQHQYAPPSMRMRGNSLGYAGLHGNMPGNLVYSSYTGDRFNVCAEEDEQSNAASIVMTDDEKDDRPYKCKINGCNKAYKNPGGLKYHIHHGHCEDTGDPEMNDIINKPYQCTVAECGKRYKNLNGLKYHIEHSHANLIKNQDN